MKEKDLTPVSLQLPSDLVEELDAIAEKEHRSRTGQITVFLKEALNNHLEAA